MRIFFGGVLVTFLLLGAFIGAFALALPLIPLERLASEFESKASVFLGREVSIEGKLRLRALPSPRLHVENLALANWKESETREMAKVEEIDFVVALMPLFRREIHVQQLIMRRPTLVLEQSSSGANWQLNLQRTEMTSDDEQKPQPVKDGFVFTDLNIHKMKVIGGTIYYKNSDAIVHQIHDAQISAKMKGLDQTLSVELEGLWKKNKLRFSGKIDNIINFLEKNPITISGQASFENNALDAQGTVTFSPSFQLDEFTFSANGPKLSNLISSLNMDFDIPLEKRVLGAYRVSGTLNYQNALLDLQSLSLDIDDLSLKGDILASFKEGFFAQTRQPVQLTIGNVNKWLQALPNPPVASAPDLLTQLEIETSAAISANSFEVFDAKISMNDFDASGAGSVSFGNQLDDLKFQTIGPVQIRVDNLNRWLKILSNPAIPDAPELFSTLLVEGDILASSTNFTFRKGDVRLADLHLKGDIAATYGKKGIRYESLSPVSLKIGNTNEWLDLLPKRPLPDTPNLFGALIFQGQLKGDLDKVTFEKANIRLGDIQTSGSMTAEFGSDRFQLQSHGPISAAGPNLYLIAEAFGVPLPRVIPNAYGAFSTRSDIKLSNKQLTLSNFQTQIDQTQAKGQIFLDFNAKPTSFNINLSADNVDTRPYITLRGHKPSERQALAKANPQAPWGEAPLNINFLKAAEGQAILQFNAVTTNLVNLGQTTAQISWRDGTLASNIQGTQLYGGRASGKIALSQKKDIAGLAFDINLSGVDAGKVLEELMGVDHLKGVTTLNINAATQGKNLQNWMSGLNGRFTAKLDPLVLLGIDFNQSLNNLKRGEFRAVQGPNAQTKFHEIDLRGAIHNGVTRIEDLKGTYLDFNLSGTGDIDIGLQRIDYTFDILYNNHVPVPLVIKGPWTKPAVRINSQRVLEFALENPQLFLGLLPKEWNLQGLLPEDFDLLDIKQRANQLFAQEQRRLESLARREMEILAQQAEIEAQRLAQEATVATQKAVERLAIEAEAAIQSQTEQLKQQATQAAEDALVNFLGEFLGN